MKNLLRAALLAFSTLAFTIAAMATVPLGSVLVSGTNTQNSAGVTEVNGTISFAPVNNVGQPISFRAPIGGQTITAPVTALRSAIRIRSRSRWHLSLVYSSDESCWWHMQL